MAEEPLLTVLNYSGGKQSSALLWMVIRGDLPRPDSLVVLNADPGMENSETYEYNKMMFRECEKAGIEAFTVEGPNLYEDLVTLEGRGADRIDNPPYWTKAEDGKKGKLRQSCTYNYKIAPMDRAMRRILEERFGISRKSKRLGENIVCKWIGFSYDEVHRIKPSPRKYWYFEYPLVDLKMDTEAVIAYYEDNSLPIPPRSVCNACFANGLNTFKKMHDERPLDWQQAVAVDDSVRDWTQIGVQDEVYVSNTLMSLRELAERNFDIRDEKEDADSYSCDSGYCFT